MRLLYLLFPFVLASISIDLHSKYSSKEEMFQGWISKKSKRFLKDPSAKISNMNNLLYYADIFIGTPPQNFTCQIDTGSLRLWVDNKHCSWCHKCNNTFNPAASSTFLNTNHSEYTAWYLNCSTIEYRV